MPIGSQSRALARALVTTLAGILLLAGQSVLADAYGWSGIATGGSESEKQAMDLSGITAIKSGRVPNQSARPEIAAPTVSPVRELLLTYSDRKSRARIELGALGGGRADAPGLVHVGLGMNF